MADNECFHTEDEQHIFCEEANLAIAVDKQTGDVLITSRKEKYKPVTRMENEKYIQIVLEKMD